MRQISLLAALLAAGCFTCTSAHSQNRDIRAAAIQAALTAEYDSYVEAFYNAPPGTMEGLVRAVLYWSPLDSFKPATGEKLHASRLDKRRGTGSQQLEVKIDSVAIKGGSATVTVTKRMTGEFLQGASTRRGHVEGYVLSRHLWMNTGNEWKLMTVVPVEGWIRMGGKAFTIPARAFDPNRAFSMPDIIETAEHLPRS